MSLRTEQRLAAGGRRLPRPARRRDQDKSADPGESQADEQELAIGLGDRSGQLPHRLDCSRLGQIRAKDIEVQRKRLASRAWHHQEDSVAACRSPCATRTVRHRHVQSRLSERYALFNAEKAFVCEPAFAEPVLVGIAGWTRRLDRRRAISHRVAASGGRRAAVGGVAPAADPLRGRAIQPVVRARLLQLGDMLRWAGIAPLIERPRDDGPDRHRWRTRGLGEPGAGLPMLDAVVIGEVEPVIEGLKEVLLGGGSRWEQIERLARLPGVYVPALYAISQRADGRSSGSIRHAMTWRCPSSG